MYTNDYMYAVERDSNSLAHYGVLGMRWGVRKAIASGNDRRLSKHFAKAQKKLAKLEKQAGKTKKYAKRAALMGAGAAVAGGLATRGTRVVSDVLGGVNRAGNALGRGLSSGSKALQRFSARKLGTGAKTVGLTGAMLRSGNALQRATAAGGSMNNSLRNIAADVNKWGNSNSIGQGLKVASRKFSNAKKPGLVGDAYRGVNKALMKSGHGSIVNQTDKFGKISNNTIARIGAGAIGAGLAAGAARNAYKAATAQKKAARFRSEMNKAFAGTKYASGRNRQGKKRRR